MLVRIVDTNVLLDSPIEEVINSYEPCKIVIPFAVLKELDTFKTSSSDILRHNARVASRFIDNLRSQGRLNEGIQLPSGHIVMIELNHNDVSLPIDLPLNVDGNIIRVAKGLQNDGNEVCLVTQDVNARIIADMVEIPAQDFGYVVNSTELYQGWRVFEVSEERLTKFATEGMLRTRKQFYQNEYVILTNELNSKHTMLAKYDGESLIKFDTQTQQIYGIKGFNVQQRFLIDLLTDDSIKLITAVGPAGTGKCITGDSIILTEEGMLPIASLGPATDIPNMAIERPLTVASLMGREQASHWYYDGIHPTYKITSRLGYSIEGTEEHPLLVVDQESNLTWKKLGTILIDDYICIQKGQNLFGPNIVDKETARLLGYLVANGTNTSNNQVVFTTNDNTLKDDYVSIMNKKFGINTSRKELSAKTTKLECNSTAVREQLYELGLSYTSENNKEIPHCIMTAERNSVIEYLKAYILCKGYIKDKPLEMRLNTTSLLMAKQLHIVFANLGIISKLKTHQRASRPETSYTLLIRNTNCKLLQEILNTDNYTPTASNNVSTDDCGTINIVLDDSYFFDKVVSIHSGQSPVYDFVVPNSHSFCANAIMNHNTLLALAAGLDQTEVIGSGTYKKMFVTRSPEPMGKEIGFLPGTEREKLSPWLGGIFDNLEFLLDKYASRKDGRNGNPQEAIKALLDFGRIELRALTHIRGRSIPNQFIIIDESQNLSKHEIKTIVSRAGENTKVILLGDIEQIDNPRLNINNNGLIYLVEAFKGQPIYGHIFLTKTERSPLANLAVKLL